MARRHHSGGTLSGLWKKYRKRCHLCRRPVRRKEASKDHATPRHAGGPDKAGNYKLAHAGCNGARGHLPLQLAYDAIEQWMERNDGRTPTQEQARSILVNRRWAWVNEQVAKGLMSPINNRRYRYEQRTAAGGDTAGLGPGVMGDGATDA